MRARARFFPEMSFAARYSRAEGGREIDVPLGSLLNPVYSTLNELLAAQGQPRSFRRSPTRRSSSSASANRTRASRCASRCMRLRFPPPSARSARCSSAEFGRVAVARRLKRDVTVAYLDWLKATKTVDIVQASLSLLEENLRVNESLFRNGKVTQDQVLRARAELLAVVQQLREARNGQSQARSYVNFLLNRSLETELIPPRVEGEVARTVHDLVALRTAALANRPGARSSSIAPRARRNRACSSRART